MIAEGWATLSELKTVWTLSEVFDANDALDLIHAERARAAKTKPPAK